MYDGVDGGVAVNVNECVLKTQAAREVCFIKEMQLFVFVSFLDAFFSLPSVTGCIYR